MKKFLKFAALILMIGAGIGAFWLIQRDRVLSVRPARAAGSGKEVEADSAAMVSVQLAYHALEMALAQKIPAQITESGQGENTTHPFPTFLGPGPGVSVDYRWSILLERQTIHVAPGASADQLAVAVPMKVSGWGGLQGGGAGLVGADRRNFRGNLEISCTATATVDKDWQPRLHIEPTHHWTQAPEIEVMSGVWITVQAQVDAKVTETLQKAKKDAESALDRDTVRKAVAPEWRTRRCKLGSYDGNDIVTTLTPLSVGFSGMRFLPQGAKFIFSLDARSKTVLAASAPLPPDGPPLPLPDLTAISGQASRTVLKLPIYVAYETLSSALVKSVPKDGYHSDDTPLGKATVWVEDATVYPTEDDRLAVGVKIKAKFERKFLDVNGWIWLTARPRLDGQRQMIAFDDIKFTRALDNTLVQAATVLLQDRIQKLLEANAAVAFGTRTREIDARLHQLPPHEKLPDGLQITVQDLKAFCDSPIILTDDKLGLHVRVETAVSCELQAIPVP